MRRTKPERVLVHAPFGRDAALICHFLTRSGIAAESCTSVEQICTEMDESTGAVLISDEALNSEHIAALAAVLSAQPPWSDLPVLVTTSGGDATPASRKRLETLGPLGNVFLLERPLRTITLVSAVQAALRARHRQYQLREHVSERERLVQELERSNEELTQFAHVVSHDLQAPVRMISAFTELLARDYRGRLDRSADEYIATIQDGASSMDALVHTLLSYATVGQEPLARESVDLCRIVDAVIATIRPTIEELRAVVSRADLPTLFGDPVLLRQLMQNLIGNGLKYAGDVTPSVRVSARQSDREWVVEVTDNGPGIPVEHHETIFQPLKRLHGKEISGTGMGLAVCRKIVERHGGRIWVESRPGHGASFLFTLPSAESGARLTHTHGAETPEREEPLFDPRTEG